MDNYRNKEKIDISFILNEIQKLNNQINSLNIIINKKEDDIKNIINEKDNIIKEMSQKLYQQEIIITNSKKEILDINKKIEDFFNQINNDLKEKEKIIKDNKESIIKINNKIFEKEKEKEKEKEINDNLEKLEDIDNKSKELNDKIIMQNYNINEKEKIEEESGKEILLNDLFEGDKNGKNNDSENIKKENKNENIKKYPEIDYFPAIILDNHSNILKLGLSNRSKPIYEIPSLLGFSFDEYNKEALDLKLGVLKENIERDEVIQFRSLLELTNPTKQSKTKILHK